MARATRPNSRDDFEIAIICALPLEADAVVALFDRHWDDEDEMGDASPYDKAIGDSNTYSAGRVGRHDVVVAHMPGEGKARAATVAAHCRMSWPSIKLALVVGICGALPFVADDEEIILGDVVISKAVVQHDLGRRLPERFIRKDTLLDSLGRPSEEILGLLAKLEGVLGRRRLVEKMVQYVGKLREDPDLKAEYPGVAHDRLFVADYRHLVDGKTCEDARCSGDLIKRGRLAKGEPKPSIHFGLIASGDTLMKSGEHRDSTAEKEGVIAFEMESAGLWGVFPCVVIKGVSDYADSHKPKKWQRYAAAMAAACAKAFLEHWTPSPQANSRASDRPVEMPGAPKSTTRMPRRYLPFRENRNFVGRGVFMHVLREKLFSNDDGAPHRVAISGLGGVGKTQAALSIAYWTVHNKPGWHVFWLPALSMATFEQACRDIAGLLELDGEKDKDARELMQCYLESEDSGRWLLVVDNADDEDIIEGKAGQEDGKPKDAKQGIRDYLPRSSQGRILFTTRVQHIATRLAQSEVVVLSQMDPDESRNLLKQSVVDKSLMDEEGVPELLDILTHLPLAITQAAAYLNETMESVSEYIRLLQNTERDMVELLEREFSDETRYRGVHNAVARTLIVSFEQIRKNPDASMLLGFMAHVEPKAISRSMLPPVGSEQRMTRAIGILCGYSFLSRREDRTVFDMHRLVHVASRAWEAMQTDAEQRRRAALKHLTRSSQQASGRSARGGGTCCHTCSRQSMIMTRVSTRVTKNITLSIGLANACNPTVKTERQ